jgi:hypothetical protein
MFTHQVNVEMRILHPPDLPGHQGLERNSVFLVHWYYYLRIRVTEPMQEGNGNPTKSAAANLLWQI